MSLDLSAVGRLMHAFFGKNIERVARQTQFVQRHSKLNGQTFLQALVFGFIQKPEASLEDLAQGCHELGVSISAQGLDQRFNEASVRFLQTMFQQALSSFHNKIPLAVPLLQQFSCLNIVDSSVIALPAQMQTTYPGCKGKGPQASLKVQLLFEFLWGNLHQLVLQPGRQADQSFRDYLPLVQPNSLTLLDLGYFCLDAFKAIMQQAYVLSRFLPKVGLLTSTGQPLNLLTWLDSQKGAYFDLPVQMGQQAKHRLACRLIGWRLPQEVADRRRQKVKQKARRTNTGVKKAYLASLDWNLFVTNVPTPMLSAAHVPLVYAVRWQIELIFKLWKSYARLNRVAGLRRERILVELYAKMIGLVLTHFLVAPLRFVQQREVSAFKLRGLLQRFARDLAHHLTDLSALLATLTEMMQAIQRFGWKNKRKKCPNVCQGLALASATCILLFNLDHKIDLPHLLP
ncbi:MAG TPA: IS4 family transposase [Anaerolineae bacterium]|nr:IS4 family transposase [Anaerolineae bacterium]HXV97056.1 IS4 family transposase [Anaerolineae bacterium]